MRTISVVIPTYNRAHRLARAIQSVPDVCELIVVDDGSTDNTDDVITQFPHVKYIKQENSGVSAARNSGIKIATGNYIAFLDSDDEFSPDKFDSVLPGLVNYTDQIFTHNGRAVIAHMRHLQKSGQIFESLLDGCWIYPSTVIVHRSVIDTVGFFDERLKSSEDVNWLLRVAAHYDIDFIPQQHSIIHQRHGSCLSNYDQYEQAIEYLLDYSLGDYEKWMISDKLQMLRNNNETAMGK